METFHFTKLHFRIKFLKEGDVPEHKSSALRGGMGQALLRMYCVSSGQQCESCLCRDRCIVQNVMYSSFKIRPSFVTKGESAGFTLFCESQKNHVKDGDIIPFDIILYGDVVSMFYPILQAFYFLGREGLGKERIPFEIISVSNQKGDFIVRGLDVDIQRVQIDDSDAYVKERKKELEDAHGKYRIIFQSPCTIKYQGNFLKKFDIDAILKSAVRRYRMYCMFEGKDVDYEDVPEIQIPQMTGQKSELISMPRFSERTETKMYIKGIAGWLEVQDLSEEMLEILLIGEVTRIGKNTKFGFGKYVVSV